MLCPSVRQLFFYCGCVDVSLCVSLSLLSFPMISLLVIRQPYLVSALAFTLSRCLHSEIHAQADNHSIQHKHTQDRCIRNSISIDPREPVTLLVLFKSEINRWNCSQSNSHIKCTVSVYEGITTFHNHICKNIQLLSNPEIDSLSICTFFCLEIFVFLYDTQWHNVGTSPGKPSHTSVGS